MQYLDLLIMIIIALVAYATAAIAYHILAPWHESRIGRWYMAQLVVITASLALILANRVLSLGIAIVYVIYGLFAIVGIGTAITIITTQVNQARHPDDTQPLDVVPNTQETLDATAPRTEEQHRTAPEPPEGNASS